MKLKDKVIYCYNHTAKEYADKFFNELEGKPLDRLLLTDFAQNCSGKLLDVGCGCGHTTRFLFEHGATDILGVDLSSEMIKQAQTKNDDLDINFQVDNILESALPNNQFSNIIAFYAIVHFSYDELERAFEEIYRICQPNGQFLFSFHVGEETTILEEFLGKKVDIEFYFFMVDKVIAHLTKQGWIVEDVLVRHPYIDKEYPSQRAYIRCSK